MKIFHLCCLLLFISLCQTGTTTTLLWPLPKNITLGSTQFVVSPCSINYILESPLSNYLKEVIAHYQVNVFKCSEKPVLEVVMNVIVVSGTVVVPTKREHEAYSLTIRENGKWELRADYFPGFVRGFETFSQLFQVNDRKQSVINGVPVFIDDTPDFLWRGILIDTSRHFLSVQSIKATIDALMYSKMNVLHWHIVDEDSFPLQIPARPELSQFGKLSGTYSPKEVEEIVKYAMIRGIRVVPEIDTPAHSQSWGRSEKYKEIALNCNGRYGGQLDPTLPLTWEVLTDILLYTNASFPDSYVHFGGDEVDYQCWGQRKQIKTYMKEHNISSYFELSVDFRKRQKSLWRNTISSKKTIYWANEDIDLPLEEDDVVQWWGVSQNVHKLKGRKNEVILSNYDLTYLDKGFGEYDGYFADYFYQHWRMMYAFQPKIKDVNVIGGEVCMWDEVGNQHTHQQKVILRANVLSERLWNHDISIKNQLANIAGRLTSQAKRLRQRGLKISPVTVGLCESKDMSICFH